MGNDDTEDQAPEDDGSGKGLSRQKTPQKCFDDVARNLGPEDLKNPALHKMSLAENDRLEAENINLKRFEQLFYKSDKEVAVLKEKGKRALSLEILSITCLTIGAILIGLNSHPFNKFEVVLGAILIIGGIIAKGVKR